MACVTRQGERHGDCMGTAWYVCISLIVQRKVFWPVGNLAELSDGPSGSGVCLIGILCDKGNYTY
jgi:hypothetical protein